MDPNNQNPQGDNGSVNKLEQDLQNIKDQTAATQTELVPEVTPVAQIPQVTEVPPAVPGTPASPMVPAENSTFVPESPKKGSPLLIIAIVLAVVALLAVVAYVFGAKLFNPRPTPTPIAVVTSSPTTDPTANWKTYTDQKYNFSFKYPPDWDVVDIVGGVLTIAPKSNIATLSASLSKYRVEGGYELGKLSTSQLIIYSEGTGEPSSNEYWKIAKTSMQIDNKTANKYVSTNIKDTPNGTYVVGDIETEVSIPIGLNGVIDYSLSDYKYIDVFNKILSTFKFIEETPAASPTVTPSSSPSGTPLNDGSG